MPQKIREVLEAGIATSAQIQATTGLNQTVVARRLREMGNEVVKLDRTRPPRYTVDPNGSAVNVGTLRPLINGGFFVSPLTGTPTVLMGAKGDGYFDDLPYFLADLRPQGFIGRHIAAALHAQTDNFPPNPRNWTINHIGRYLIANGEDLPCNFKIGPSTGASLKRQPIPSSSDDYPRLADEVMQGIPPGSSAGGEQPKFTAFTDDIREHVIVKFSPVSSTELSLRWRDILLTEYHATGALHSIDFPAAQTRIFEIDDRIFLESQRFDRTGEYGRMPMISLQAIDAEFVCEGDNWPRVLRELMRQKLINHRHVNDAEFLWDFGRLINNSDMHLGNLSLGIEEDAFQLLPTYDMCSMGFAPVAGTLSPYHFHPPDADSLMTSQSQKPRLNLLLETAKAFWNSVAEDDRISDDFKRFLDLGNPIDLLTGSR